MISNSNFGLESELGPDFYDRMHADSDPIVTRTRYNALFRKVVSKICEHGSGSILEVGCGSGYLAERILKQCGGNYRGFDFSSAAIHNAGVRTGRPELFAVADAYDPRSYDCEYDTIVCTEVLEHVDRDLHVIRMWRVGTWCVCSVPNFYYEGHVRFFTSIEEVAARYNSAINIENIIKIPRPLVPDRSIRTYLRNLRWSRNDPSQLLGFLGIQTFERLGGWFLFWGARRWLDHSSYEP